MSRLRRHSWIAASGGGNLKAVKSSDIGQHRGWRRRWRLGPALQICFAFCHLTDYAPRIIPAVFLDEYYLFILRFFGLLWVVFYLWKYEDIQNLPDCSKNSDKRSRNRAIISLTILKKMSLVKIWQAHNYSVEKWYYLLLTCSRKLKITKNLSKTFLPR